MDKPTAQDLPKLKTQLPDPLLVLSFTHDDLGNVLVEIRYASNVPGNGMMVFRGQVHQPGFLLNGLMAAVEGARG